ncbi:hypothetical protein FACS1894177_08510 [Bacteroidia bacterium]|nr:hypothetical protein FACS1894177_08510 [Bacteroidia bacterium]
MKNNYGGYNATWAPGIPLQIGDIGVFDEDGAFDRKSNIAYFKIAFDICPDTTNDQLNYSSKGSASITAKLSGQIAPGSVLAVADVGAIVEFSKENSVVFKAKNVSYPSIADQIQLEKDVIALYNQKQWNKDWCIITELVVAESATIIISNSSNGKIELKANANLSLAKIDIADAAFDFSTQFAKNLNTTIIAQEGLTPLFKARKLTFKGGGILQSPKTPDGLRQVKMRNKPVSGNVNMNVNANNQQESIITLDDFVFNF